MLFVCVADTIHRLLSSRSTRDHSARIVSTILHIIINVNNGECEIIIIFFTMCSKFWHTSVHFKMMHRHAADKYTASRYMPSQDSTSLDSYWEVPYYISRINATYHTDKITVRLRMARLYVRVAKSSSYNALRS